MIRIYVANLGKYNEGEHVGNWIDLPATEDEMNELFVEIGVGQMVDDEYKHGIEVDGVVYEEYAIHDSETDIDGLEIGEYSSISRLNEVAERLENADIEILNMIYENTCDLHDAMEILEKGDYTIIHGVRSKDDLGREYINQVYGNVSELGRETLEQYFDYEAYAEEVLEDFVMGEDKALEVHNH